MKRRFTDEQIIGVLKEHESGEPVAEICRRHGIGQSTLYKWKAKYGGMEVNDARKLKALEDENTRLKRLLADSLLDNQMLRRHQLKKVVTPDARRAAVSYLRDNYAVSERRACQCLNVDRSSIRYQSVRSDDAELRSRMKAIAAERRRFGYRRLHVMLQREGFEVNEKKIRRLYTEEKLQVKRRGGRKRALGTRRPMQIPTGPNQRWSLDFVHDAFTDGRRFRILA